jgi:hypothetical protein
MQHFAYSTARRRSKIPREAVRAQRRPLCALFLCLTVSSSCATNGPLVPPAFANPNWIATDQGKDWTNATRADFYSHDQGSRLIPLRWMTALKQANGAPFMADSLSRYGYLANESSTPPGLPVGFTVASSSNGEVLGMTCAACHTRQITVNGKAYRIDGGPAIVDFQSFLTELDVAVGSILKNDTEFDVFARAVLGSSPTGDQMAALRRDVSDWYLPYDKIMNLGLPQSPWGPGRLDAVSMIFNRLTGLDLGPPPTFIIEVNIQPATAPVRYPFLWNAARQDKTQWPGFADNGNSVLGLARNVGEVTGVFAVFHPVKDDGQLLGINYVGDNSTNFNGLDRLEQLIKMIGPPKWPWSTNPTLVAQGRKLFAQNCAANCHEVKPGRILSLDLAEATWATPIQNVGTDTREWSNMDRLVNPGVLTGASILGLNLPLKNPTAPISVLQLAVVGSIIQHALPVVVPNDLGDQIARAGSAFNPETNSLTGAFRYEPTTPARGSYESRVLRGIWAAAPYLHNGSVPTLTELLKPSRERVVAFKIGPAYDLDTVGLAVEQTAFKQVLQTTDCGDLDSGNSRCGHEFGTALSPSQKKALLEYLKTL